MTAKRVLELLIIVAKYFIGMAEKELKACCGVEEYLVFGEAQPGRCVIKNIKDDSGKMRRAVYELSSYADEVFLYKLSKIE